MMEESKQFLTPILFLIFNRPDTTEKVFLQIKKIKPKYLYVSADGPRENKIGEKEICEETRRIVLNNIDWDCELKTLFRDKNLGCKIGVSTGITWFFENVEYGIIIEDDCIPSISFFYYCEELLKYYKDNEKIMFIGGTNYQNNIKRGKGSYYFSLFNHVWGWASWRRVWQLYDHQIKDFPLFIKQNKIKKLFNKKVVQNYWLKKFSECYENKIDTWDYQLTYTIWNNNGLSIVPNKNLVTNIGFDERATHTKNSDHNSYLETYELDFPLIHPEKIKIDKKADNYTIKYHHNINTNIFYNFYSNTKNFIKGIIKRILRKLRLIK